MCVNEGGREMKLKFRILTSLLVIFFFGGKNVNKVNLIFVNFHHRQGVET